MLVRIAKSKRGWDGTEQGLAASLLPSAATEAIGAIGPEAAEATPALVELLAQTKSTWDKWDVVKALGKIGGPAEPAVPALLKLLEDERLDRAAVSALGGFGPSAKAALPRIRALAGEPSVDTGTRAMSALALDRITGKSEEAIRLLVAQLESEYSNARRDAISVLALMGGAARPAVPALKRVVNGDPLFRLRYRAEEALQKIAP